MPVREKLDDLVVRFLNSTSSIETRRGQEKIAHLLIFFILIGVSREEIFRFLVNFLLVLVQTYERVRCVFAEKNIVRRLTFAFRECVLSGMRFTIVRIDGISVFGDDSMEIDRTVVLHALRTRHP